MRRPRISLVALIVTLLISTSALRADWTFVRGDANVDGTVDFVDAIQVLNQLFVVGADPTPCRDSLDANDSGTLDLGDPIYLLQFLFEGSSPPTAPYPNCGIDRTEDSLDCTGPMTSCPEFLTTIGFELATQQIVEGAPGVQATVTLTTPLSEMLILPFQISGSATAGEDYLSLVGSISIAAGQTTAIITVPLLGDDVYEGDETLTIELVLPSFAGGALLTHSVTLLDDEPMPSVFFIGGPWSVVEGDPSVTMEIGLSGPSAHDIIVGLAPIGSAEIGSDFTMPPNPLIFSAGTLIRSVTIPITDDAAFEGTEELILVLVSPFGATLGPADSGTVFISDNDSPPTITFSVAHHAISESAAPYALEVTITPPAATAITVELALGGDGTPGVDATLASTTLTIPAGSSTAIVILTPIADLIDEPDETITVTLVSPTLSVLGATPTATVVLVDDDDLPEIGFTTATSAANETDGIALVEVSLSAPSGRDIAIPFSVGGTAGIGPDVTVDPSPAFFPAGQSTTTIAIVLVDNQIHEDDETLVLTLGAPTNATLGSIATHTVTIADDDPMPTVGFVGSALTIDEGSGGATLAVTLSGSTTDTVVVPFTLAGDASIPDDLTTGSSPIVFAPGTITALLPITAIDDLLDEGDETLSITLGTPVGAILSLSSTATITVIDNDPLPEVRFSLSASTIVEGAGTATISVLLDPPSGRQVLVPLTFSGSTTAGSDYVPPPTTVLIPPGNAGATVTIAIVDDAEFEPSETLTVAMGTPNNATLGGTSTHVLTVDDDDIAPTISFFAATHLAGESAGGVVVQVFLDTPSTVPVVASLSATGTATAGLDYVPTASLTIPPGALGGTFTIQIINDLLDEESELIEIGFVTVAGANPGGTTTHTITIVDDDPLPVASFEGPASSDALEGVGTWSRQIFLDTPSGRSVTIPIVTGGTAMAGADYDLTAPTVTFAPGETTRSVSLTITDDLFDEPDETVVLTLGTPQNALIGSPGSHTLSLLDDDGLPEVSFSSAAISVGEGNGLTTIIAELSLPAGSPVTVPVLVAGSATLNDDFAIAPSTVQFAMGATTAAVTVIVIDDSRSEADETIELTFGTPIGAELGAIPSTSVTILDDDPLPAATFGAASLGGDEGTGVISLPILIDAPAGRDITLTIDRSGTATEGLDLNEIPSAVTIPEGETQILLDIAIIDDASDEPLETLTLTLGTTGDAQLGSPAVCDVHIIDDDAPPAIDFVLATQTGNEGETVTVAIALSAPSGFDITVPINLSGDAQSGLDYLPSTTTISLPAGSSGGALTLDLLPDNTFEGEETIEVSLAPPTLAILGAATTQAITIVDGDSPPVVTFTSALFTITEGNGLVRIGLEVSGPSEHDLVLPWTATGSATLDSDYVTAPNPLIVPAGALSATLTLIVIDDAIAEPTEGAVITLDPPTNAILGAISSVQVTILDDADPVPSLAFTSVFTEVGEGSGEIALSVSLASPSGSDIVVPFSVSGTATPGIDYLPATSPLIVPAGTLSTTIALTILEDEIDEPNETVTVALGIPVGATLGTNTTSTVRILDNDAAPSVHFETTGQTVPEDLGSFTVTLLLDGTSASPVTVMIGSAGDATLGNDLLSFTPTITFPAGVTSTTLPLTIVDDLAIEADENLVLTLASPTGATIGTPASHSIVIVDNDVAPVVEFTTPDFIASEGDGLVTLTVGLSAPTAVDVVVQLTLSGTALPSADFGFAPNPVVIPAGSLTGTAQIFILNDTLDEPDETVVVTIASVTGGDLGAQTVRTVTIVDDGDVPPTVQFTQASQGLGEGAFGISITVGLSGPSGFDLSVPITTTGSATEDIDFSVSPSQLLIPAGASFGLVQVTPIQDLVDEAAETIELTLGATSNAILGGTTTHLITLIDDDAPPEVFFGAASLAVAEGAASLAIPISLDALSELDVTVPLTSGGTATASVDYFDLPSTVTIPAGTLGVSLSLAPIDDLAIEGDEEITLSLGAATNATAVTPLICTVTIIDDDTLPIVNFSSGSQVIGESSGTTSVTLSIATAAATDVTVPIIFSGSAIHFSDFVATPLPVVIPAGQTTATLTLILLDDSLHEAAENAILTMGSITGGQPGAQNVHTLTITDTDPPPTVGFSIAAQTIAEGTSSASLELRLSAVSGIDVQVPLSISGSAILGTDILLPGTQVTIPAGQLSVNFPLTVIDDTLDEPIEFASFALGTPIGATLAGITSHQVTVLDNDDAPTISFASGSGSAAENSSSTTILARLSAASAFEVTVPLTATGNATEGVDYSFAPSTLTIPPGQTEALITITLVDDLAVELDEMVALTLGTANNATLAAPAAYTLTIIDNDLLPTITFASPSQSLAENAGIVTVSVLLSAPTASDVIVPITLAGTATFGADFTLAPNPLTILAGQTAATVQLVLIDDALNELTETLFLTLGTPTNGTLGTATTHEVTILDSGDPLPTVNFATLSQNTLEGPGTILVSITLSSASGQDVIVPLVFSGSAVNGEDYLVTSDPMVIPAGQTNQLVAITLVDDLRYELSETISLTMGPPSGSSLGPSITHTITIADGDPRPTAEFAAAASAIGEGSGSSDVLVVLSAIAGVDVTVPFTISGSATPGADFIAPPPPLVIPAGSASAALPLALIDDIVAESDETISLALSTPTNAVLGPTSHHVLTIGDNEGVPEVSFLTATESAIEGNTLISIPVVLSIPTGVDVTVPYSLSGSATAGMDYALPAGPAVIPAGNLSTTLTLVLIDDTIDELAETIEITLGSPTGSVLGSPLTHTVTINDNGDPPPTIGFSVASSTAGEGDGIAQIAVTLDHVSGQNITIPYTVSGTALFGSDHFIAPGPLVIPAGALGSSIAVHLIDDLLDEPTELITITFGIPSSGFLGAVAVRTLEIIDNDTAPRVSFETAALNVSESEGTIAARLTLDLPSGGDIAVPFTITGTATAGTDFTAPISPVTIPAGATEVAISLALIDDLLFEGVETIVLTLGSPSGATVESPAALTVTVLDDEQQPIVSFAQATGQVTEASTSFSAEVLLSIPASEDVTVPFTVGGTADPILDFAVGAGPVVIPAGATSASITVVIHEDQLDEGNELITLALGTPVGAVPGAILVQSVTILDDDPPPSATFITASTNVLEGSGPLTIEVGLSAPSGLDAIVSWTVGGSALPGQDFTLNAGSVTLPAGTVTASFTVDILGDSLDEANETILLALGSLVDAVAGIPATTTITILDDDNPPTLQFQSTTSLAGESGGTLLIPIALGVASGQDILVETLLSGSATQGLDYLFDPTPVRIEAGETSAFLVVELLDDVQIETDETISLTLIDPTNANLGAPSTHVITVIEDDIAPTVTITPLFQTLPENAGAITATIQLSEAAGIDVLVPFTVTGTADLGDDATMTSSPVVIPAGQTSVDLTITIIDDLLVELDETLTVTLGAPVNGVLGGNSMTTLTILDDEPIPVVEFASTSVTTSETGPAAVVTVVLSAPSTLDITIGASITGSATNGIDSTISGQPILIPAGETSAAIIVTPIDDLLDELDETVILTLETPNQAVIGTNATATVTISDNDASPTVGFVSGFSSTTEGAAATELALVLSAPSGLDVSVPFTSSGSASGLDFELTASPVVILAGETTGSISLLALLDGLDEPTESTTVALGTPTHATLGTLTSHAISISDADPPTVIQFLSSSTSTTENAGSISILLELAVPSGIPVTVPLTVSGTATSGVDALLLENSVTILAGLTQGSVTVDLLDDLLSEPTETFVITIGSPTGATLGARSVHTVSIVDDEAVPVINFDIASQSISEGAADATVGISLDAPSGVTLSIPLTLTGTATAGTDYTTPVIPIVVPPGATSATITVPLIDDPSDEPNETITLALGVTPGAQTGPSATHVITIEDNDVAPELSFTTAVATRDESSGPLTLDLFLSSPSASPVTASISTFGTAANGIDYSLSSTSVSFPPGSVATTLTLSFIDDALHEANESVVVAIDAPTGATLGAIPVETVTILDNDPAPSIAFSAATSTAGESATAVTIIVSLSAPSGLPIVVPFTIGGSATNGLDYTASPSPLVIPPGQVSGAIVLHPVADPLNEFPETIELTLGTPSNGFLGAPLLHVLTLEDESDLPSVFFDQSAQTRVEGSGLATATLRLSPVSALDVTVALAVGGTAAAGLDFGTVPSSAVILAGSDQVTISIPLVTDSLDEPDETITLEILGASDAIRGVPDVHTITIADDDDPPLLSLSAPTGSIDETSSAFPLTVTLDTASGRQISVPVTFAGSASSGVDYSATPTVALFPPGTTAVDITITPIDDLLHEGPETIVASLGAPTNASLGSPVAVTVTLADDEPTPIVSLGAIPTSVPETAGTVQIPILLTGPSALDLTIPFTIGGSASAGSDFVVTANSVLIPAGSTTATIPIEILDDLVHEPTQSIVLDLVPIANATLGAPASATIEILDNEPIPVLSISPTLAVIPEAAGVAPLTVTLSVPSENPVIVPITYSGGAVPSVDFVQPPTTVTIAAGSTGAPLTIATIDDPLFEHDETVIVTLGTPPNAIPGPQSIATITILDDETRPNVTVSGPVPVSESAGSAVIQVTLSGPIGADLTVPTTFSGTATAGLDYTPPAGVLVIPAGTLTASLTIPFIDDSIDEATETIVISLGATTEADLGSPSVFTLQLLDDDPAPILAFSQSGATVDESVGTLSLTVTSSTPSSLAVSSAILFGGSADPFDDATVSPSVVTIPAGQTSATITVTVIDDGFDEPDETLALTLDTPMNATLGAISTFALAITDNDTIPAVQFDVSNQSVGEGAGTVTATVLVSVPSALVINVPFTWSGDAVLGTDFTSALSPLSIPAGAASVTISFTITDDAIFEGNEPATLTLGTPDNASLGMRSAQQITILDNDPAPFVEFMDASSTIPESVGSTLIDVVLSAPAEVDIVVPLTTGGTATAGIDAQIIGNPLLFTAGTTLVQVQVDVLSDSLHEGDETFSIGFGATLGATPGTTAQHTITISDDDPAPVVTFATASSEALEDAGTIAIAVLLSEASELPTTVPYSLSGSAFTPSDFAISASPLVIPAGAVSGSIEITIEDDLFAEGEEAVTIEIDLPTNATVGTPATHLLAIRDNDVVPTVSFATAVQSVGEVNGFAQIVVVLSEPAGVDVTVPVSFGGSAVLGLDYVTPPGPLVIPAGSVSESITLTLIDDALAESDETVVAILGTPVGANLGAITVHTTTLLDNEATPVVDFAVDTQSVGEGATVTTVSVLLSAVSTLDVTIPYLISGTASIPGDLTVTPDPLTIPAGQLSTSLTLNLIDDALDETDETVEISLSPPTGAALGTGTVHTLTIFDDDAPPTVNFTVPSSTVVTEGSPTFALTAELDAPSGLPITAPFLLGGPAGNPSDLVVGVTSFTFPAGSTSASVTVAVIDDIVSEATEIATITLDAPVNATLGAMTTHTVTILDDEPFPAVSFLLASSTRAENAGSTTIDLILDAPSAAPVSIDVALSGEAATGGDATVADATIDFAPGALTASVTVDLVDDAIFEGDETLVLTLTMPNGTQLGATTIHTLTVTDDESIPSLAFTLPAQDLAESASGGSITLSLTGARDEDTLISLSTGGTATEGVDVIAVASTATIPAGATTAVIALTPLPDILDEPNETFTVTIDSAPGVAITAPSTHVVTILDDDDPPQISFSTPSFTLSEGNGTIGVGILLSAPSAQTVTVDLLSGGTALLGSDFASLDTPVQIPPLTTSIALNIPLIDDALYERTESLSLSLDNPQGATLGATTISVVTILDDDPAPVIRFDSAASNANEAAGTVALTVLLDAVAAVAIDVPFTIGGSATFGTDFTVDASPLTIPAGALSATIGVNLTNDLDEEINESVIATLGIPSDGTLAAPSATTLTIIDDDVPQRVSFEVAASSAAEGSGLVTIALELNKVLPTDVIVPITLTGTATDTADYASATTSVTILAGELTIDASLVILDDLLDELDETVLLTLGPPIGAGLGTIDQHLLTITDDDEAPTLTLIESVLNVTEAQGVQQLTVSLSAASGLDVTVPLLLSGSAAAGDDYTVTASPLTIPAGNTLGTVTWTPIDDPWFEPTETATLTLGAPDNATLGANIAVTITVTDNDPFPSVTFDSSSASIAEGGGTLLIPMTLSSLTDTDVVVPLLVAGSATSGDDFELGAASALIPARSLTGDIVVEILQDNIDELTETIELTLDAPVGADLGTTITTTITLLDDDPLPSVQFSGSTTTVSEGPTSISIALSLSGPSSREISVPFTLTGSATETVDYAVPMSPITFAAGETAKLVEVTILDDLLAEGDEDFVVTLGVPNDAVLGTEIVFTGTILDDETASVVSFEFADSSIGESGASISATIELSIPSLVDLSIPLTISGDAVPGVDLSISPNPVQILAGELQGTVVFLITPDLLHELDETLTLTIDPPLGTSLGVHPSHTLTIIDDDAAPTVSFTTPSTTATEDAGTILIEATISDPSGLPVSVPISLTGSANIPNDVTVTPDPMLIPAGSVSAFFSVAITDDLFDEDDETVEITLGTPTGATHGVNSSHTVLILDNDDTPTVAFDLPSSTALESAPTAAIELALSAVSGLPVTVFLSLSGTATPGIDYTTPPTTVLIAPGTAGTTVSLPILQDLLDENTESVTLEIIGVIGATIGTPSTHDLSILDDDNEPTVGFATPNVSQIEDNGTTTIDIVLSPITGRDVTVNFSIAGTASSGVDYTAPSSPVTISAGSASASIQISVTPDLLDEPDETVVLSITSVVNAQAGGISNTTLTITDDDDAPSVAFDLPGQSIGESAAPVDVDVSLSAASGRTITVPVDVSGSALVGTDAQVSATSLTFDPGEITATVTITPLQDLLDEDPETVVLTLGPPSNAILGGTVTHTATILDDDDAPMITLDVAPLTLPEGGGAITVGATLSSPSGLAVTATLALTGTATNSEDFSFSSTTLSIPAGSTAASVTLTITDDAIFEGDETVTWTIDSASGATIDVPATRTLTIIDDEVLPTVTFTSPSSQVGEGIGSTDIALTLSGESATAVTVPITVSGSATPIDDFVAAPIPVVFNPGQTTAAVTVTVVADALSEPNETVILDLGTPSGAGLGGTPQHTLTITDNDGVPSVAFDSPTATLDESGGSVVVLVELSAVSALDVTIPYSVGGSASASDHTTTTSPLVISAGATQGTITIAVTEDSLHEANETVQLTIGLPQNATIGAVPQFTLTILDNDGAPEVHFVTTSQLVAENAGLVTATLELGAVSGLATTIDLVTTGTATNGADYNLAASQIVIPAGQLQATVSVTIIDDAIDEASETATLTIDAAAGATIGSPNAHTLTIVDDELPPILTFASATGSATEGEGEILISAVLSAPSSLTISVQVAATGTATAADATLGTTSLTFLPGAVTASASVTIIDDSTHEGTETVILTLSSATSATLGSPSTHTLSITDDDPEPTIQFVDLSQSVPESVGTTTIAVTLAPASGIDTILPFSITGTSLNGTDYTLTASPLTIPAGSTSGMITVTVTPDAIDEPDETIEITLDTPTGATLGTNNLHTVTINDDDGLPSVEFELASSSADENSGSALIRVILSTPSGLTVTVPFSDTGTGTAVVGLDYTAPTSPLVISPGATEAFISIALLDDGTVEGDETIALQLLSPTNAIFGSQAAHTFTINDDDGVGPCNVAYPETDVVYPPGVAIAPNVPTFACGTPNAWAITPTLPPGLVFDTGTGTISGTPTTRGVRTEYTVTASNGNGSDQASIFIRIDPIFEFFAGPAVAEYDPGSGDLIPAGGTLPDPLATVPVSLFFREGANNQPVPNTFTPTAGLSVALTFDALLVDPQQIDMGADLIGMNGGTGPEFWGPQIGSNVVTIGVLYTTVVGGGGFAVTLTGDIDRELAVVRYAPATGSLIGNTTGLTVTMPYGNPNGPTGVQNQVVIDGSTGVLPVTTDVVIEFQPQ